MTKNKEPEIPAEEITELFAECLREIYKKLLLDVPDQFVPSVEAKRICDEVFRENIHLAFDATRSALSLLPYCSNSQAKADALYERALVAIDQFTYDVEVAE